MFSFMRNLAVSCILRIMTTIVLFLLVVTRVKVQVSMTRNRKGSLAEVQYRAVFGKWEVLSTLAPWGHIVSLCRQSDTMLTTEAGSTSTETTKAETDPRLPDV